MAHRSSVEFGALDRAGYGLKAVFTKRGDRYDHQIFVVSPTELTPLLIAEPMPLQEAVDHKSFDGSRAILLTGAGGGAYWSATVSATVDVRLAILTFDLACRGQINNHAAAKYRLSDRVAHRDGMFCLPDGRSVGIWGAPIPGSIATEFIPTCTVAFSDRGVTLTSANAPHVTTNDSTRWSYELRYAQPSD